MKKVVCWFDIVRRIAVVNQSFNPFTSTKGHCRPFPTPDGTMIETVIDTSGVPYIVIKPFVSFKIL